jgi:hypothetical protein
MPPPSPVEKLTFAIVPQVGHEKRGSFYIRLDQLKPSDDERDDQGLSEDSTTYIHIYGRFVSPPSYLGLTTLHAASTFFYHHNPILLPRIPLHSKPLQLSSSRLPLSSSRPLPQGQPPPRMHAARLQAPRRPFRRPASHRHGFQDGVRRPLPVAERASPSRQPRRIRRHHVPGSRLRGAAAVQTCL